MSRLLEGRISEIVEDYVRRLRNHGSPLIADVSSRRVLESQATQVLEDAAYALRGLQPPIREPWDSTPEAAEKLRASQGVHPSESLRAALMLSETALSVLACELSSSPALPTEVAEAALVLQRSVSERFSQDSVSYMAYLLRKAHEAQRDERRRICRELGGETAHALAAAYQSLELHGLLEARGEELGSEAELDFATEAVRAALEAVRGLYGELRDGEGSGRLGEVVSDVVSANVPRGVRATFSLRGEESRIPCHVREELRFILREALRVVLARPGIRDVRVLLCSRESGLSILVESKGERDRDESEVPPWEDVAVRNLRERVALLSGAAKAVHTAAAYSVKVSVPLTRRCARASADPRALAASAPRLGVVLAHGYGVFRQALRSTLAASQFGMDVLAEVGSYAEAVRACGDRRPDLLLLGLELLPQGIRDAIGEVSQVSSGTKVAVLAMDEDLHQAEKLLSGGADAYIAKTAPPDELISAARAAVQGESSLVLSVSHVGSGDPTPSQVKLTKRQTEVLSLAARGLSNREIAAALHVEQATVKRHLINAYAALGVNSREAAVREAFSQGFDPLPRPLSRTD
jgi:DNA-binding NarL/FixJ family response regulator